MTVSLPPFLKRLAANDFVRHNTLAFIGSVAVAVINYLYYPVLGRIMSAADFGEVQAIHSLSMQITVFLGVFNFLTIGAISKYDNDKTRNRLIAELEKVATIITLVVVGLLLISSLQLVKFFQFHSIYPLLALLVSLLVAVPSAFRNAYLQGMRDFGGNSTSGAIGAAGKLIFGLIFVLIGWRAGGAIMGLVVAQVIALLYATRRILRHGWSLPDDFRPFSLPNLRLVRPEVPFGVLVLVPPLVIATIWLPAVRRYSRVAASSRSN